jgi:hypothetical protein
MTTFKLLKPKFSLDYKHSTQNILFGVDVFKKQHEALELNYSVRTRFSKIRSKRDDISSHFYFIFWIRIHHLPKKTACIHHIVDICLTHKYSPVLIIKFYF